jgi:hypothetical protein
LFKGNVILWLKSHIDLIQVDNNILKQVKNPFLNLFYLYHNTTAKEHQAQGDPQLIHLAEEAEIHRLLA